MTTPLVIPFFIPNQGCAYRCIFCDQPATIGSAGLTELTPETIARDVTAGLQSSRLKPGRQVEVAFYGGTFTALPVTRQTELLSAVAPFIRSGQVHGLRLSTRPDRLSVEQIDFLKAMGVTTVELGAQSLDDRVLAASRRGHTADQIKTAAKSLQAAGLNLGLQLLPGLPGEDQASRKMTLEAVINLCPREVRIYPLLVLHKTVLAELYRQGKYQ
ncbi:MAG: radical SAM protein, partial [Deltaproteobacteria bacterium]|nr:radical SAM protein [Deltaproteobacteria bacterium]